MGDAISRRKAYETLTGYYHHRTEAQHEALREALGRVPSIEPERDNGKWIWDDDGYHCSECFFHPGGYTLECLDGTFKFCPVCGAEMKGENDGEDD